MKRRHSENNDRDAGRAKRANQKGGDATAINSPIAAAFKGFSTFLDDHYAKRERIIKTSRDLTDASKKLIFLLHRITGEDGKAEVLAEAHERLRAINALISKIAGELDEQSQYIYQHSYTPGMQEFVESVSFMEYVEHGRLLTRERLAEIIVFEPGVRPMVVSARDYLLGVADMTGELMRMATNAVAAGDQDLPSEVNEFMHALWLQFSKLPHDRDLQGKMRELEASVKKVEALCYNIRVRGAEYPKEALARFLTSDQGPREGGEDAGDDE